MFLSLFSEHNDQDRVRLLFKFSKMEKFNSVVGLIKGIAVPYNEKTQDYRNMSFSIGAFKKLGKVPSFVNHESWDVKSLVGVSILSDSAIGVNFEMKLNLKDPDVMNKIIPLIEMEALQGVSIGAYIFKKEDKYDADGNRTETIVTSAEIYELSLVTFQAFENARIESKKRENEMAHKLNKPELDNVVNFNQVESPVEEAPVEEAPVEEAPVEESPVEEAPVEEAPVEEAPVAELAAVVEVNEIEIMKAEIAQLKQEKVEKEKLDVINGLIRSGIVYKSQSEKIMKTFASAELINEFYKDVPASFSVKPKGEGAVDVTENQIKSELYKQVAEQTSLSEEDIIKYNK